MRVQAEGDWWERNKARLIGLLVYAGWSGAKGFVLAERGQVIQVTQGRDGQIRVGRLKKNVSEVLDAWDKKGYAVNVIPF